MTPDSPLADRAMKRALWHKGADVLHALECAQPDLYYGWDVHELDVRPFDETGLELTEDYGGVTPMGRDPVLLVCHYTAGEGGGEQVHRVLGGRKTRDGRGLSAHVCIDYWGTAWQYADLSMRCRHASAVNDRSVGFELSNRARPPAAKSRPRGETEWVFLGAKRTFLDFTPAQIKTWVCLTRVVCWAIPTIPRRVYDPRNRVPRRDWPSMAGVCGHFHVALRGKLDPGPQPLEALLAEGDFDPVPS